MNLYWTPTPPEVTLFNNSRLVVDTYIGCPTSGAVFRDWDGVVGVRKPPRDGVRVGVGILGRESSRSSNKSRLDFSGGGTAAFCGLLIGFFLTSSSELEESESLSDDSVLAAFFTDFGLTG